MTAPALKAAPIPALLLCPFCGADGDRLVCSVEGEDDYFNVGCEDCDCRTAWFDDRAGAIAAWNRRAARASQEERIREDERDALFLAAERAKRRHIRSWIGMRGGMFPADRARLRGDAS